MSMCRICPIWISEPGQLFRSQFALHLTLWTGLAGATRLTRSVCMIHMDWIYFYQRGRFAWPLFVCQIIHYTLLKYFVKDQIPNLTFRFDHRLVINPLDKKLRWNYWNKKMSWGLKIFLSKSLFFWDKRWKNGFNDNHKKLFNFIVSLYTHLGKNQKKRLILLILKFIVHIVSLKIFWFSKNHEF